LFSGCLYCILLLCAETVEDEEDSPFLNWLPCFFIVELHDFDFDNDFDFDFDFFILLKDFFFGLLNLCFKNINFFINLFNFFLCFLLLFI